MFFQVSFKDASGTTVRLNVFGAETAEQAKEIVRGQDVVSEFRYVLKIN